MASNSLASRFKGRFGRRAAPAVTVAAADSGGESFSELLAADASDSVEIADLLLDSADEGADSGGMRAATAERSEAEQIKELHTQLVAMAIENENLRAKVGQGESEVLRQLREQIIAEQEARRQLQMQVEGAGRIPRSLARLRRRRQAADAAVASAATGAAGAASGTDADLESLSSEESEADGEKEEKLRLRSGFAERARNWLTAKFLDLLDDLQPEPEPAAASAGAAPQDETLSARRLKTNFARFGRCTKPIFASAQGMQRILRWHSPSYTAMVLLLYYFIIVCNVALPAVLLLCITRLLLNYAKYRLHWNFDFNFVSAYEEAGAEDAGDREKTVGTQVNFVVHVAKKVQNLTGQLSDNMEKFKNLITWRSPQQTQRLLWSLLVAFCLSLFLPAATIAHYAGLYLGVKLFVVDTLFAKYPRLRRKYDSVHRMWLSLPTDQQLGHRHASRDVEKYILPYAEGDGLGSGERQRDRSPMASDDEQFCQVFSLPNMECPLPRWRGGKRCTIILKEADKPLLSSLKHGKLFLTRSFLCFERSKDRGKQKKRNIVIPLSMIRRAKKTKLFLWWPGGGMAIEVTIFGLEKPITFGAIIGRDDLFESLMETGRKAGLPWAGGVAGKEAAESAEQRPAPDQELVLSVTQALLSDSDSGD